VLTKCRAGGNWGGGAKKEWEMLAARKVCTRRSGTWCRGMGGGFRNSGQTAYCGAMGCQPDDRGRLQDGRKGSPEISEGQLRELPCVAFNPENVRMRGRREK